MFTLSHAARAGASALKMGVYSLLVGPGVMLTGLLMLIQPSVSEDILRNAEQLVRDAPADKVWACSHDDSHRGVWSVSSLPVSKSITMPPGLPVTKPVLCTPHLQSRSDWVRASDVTLHNLYTQAVLLSGLIYAFWVFLIPKTRARRGEGV